MKSQRRTADENGRDIRQMLTVLLMSAGMILGGGGTSNPLTEVILQAFAALAMFSWCLTPAKHPISPWLPAICVLTLILPVVQLIPLPPAIWQALPGREVERASLSLIGAQNSWMPWSIAPPQTRAVLIAMVPPLAMMWFVAELDAAGRKAVLRAIVAIAIVSVLLGAGQLASPLGREPSFYHFHHQGYVIGFQANRNAEVDVLLIALAATAALYADKSTPRRSAAEIVAYAAIALFLLLGAILSGSRGGILLIPLVLLLALAIIRQGRLLTRPTLIIMAAGATLLSLIAWLLRSNAAIGKVAARFLLDHESRPELWADTIFAIKQYWPVGGGMGAFVELMTPVERLEVLDPSLPSRAHNDYLEIVLETGIIGPIVLLTLAAGLVLIAFKTWKSKVVRKPHSIFAFAAFFIIAAHSLVDYPLRSMSLAMLMGGAAGLIMPPAATSRSKQN